jgi:hypothetical protein
VYDGLKIKPKLRKPSLNLTTAGNTPLHVDGFAEFNFIIGSIHITQKFYVVKNLNRNVILGADWLHLYGVRVYHDLKCIRVKNTYIPLENDMHIGSLARTRSKVKIPPQTSHICYCKLRKHPNYPEHELYEVISLKSGYLENEPGLLLTNSVIKLSKNRKIPVLLVNTTGKTMAIKPEHLLLSLSH